MRSPVEQILGGYENPGVAGLALLRRVTPREWLRQPQADLSFFRTHGARPLQVTTGEAATWAADKNGMYLGAASSVLLGTGEPVWYDQAPPWSAHPPAGLWHVEIMGGPSHWPPLFKKSDDWLYTPALQALAKIGFTFALKEAFLFPESHQALRPFYEAFRLARETATPDDWKRCKRVYTTTFGILARRPEGDPVPSYIFRPDWYYSLVAEAAARLVYNIKKVYDQEGLLPVRIETDALYYETEVFSLPMGTGIGQFKLK